MDVPVVMDDQHEVICHMDVELAAPEALTLSKLKGFDGVLGITGLFAVPIAPVGGDGYFG